MDDSITSFVQYWLVFCKNMVVIDSSVVLIPDIHQAPKDDSITSFVQYWLVFCKNMVGLASGSCDGSRYAGILLRVRAIWIFGSCSALIPDIRRVLKDDSTNCLQQ